MGEKRVSIIVPCFNVETYINRCIDSIISQTIGRENLEIILVNDASTDNTYSVLLDIEKEYSDNVLVINCAENHKQGCARNIGLSYASGEYVTFVDADDYIDKRMLEIMLAVADTDVYDFVECDYYPFFTDGDVNDIYDKECTYSEIIIESPEERKSLLHSSVKRTAVWGRLFRKDFLQNNSIYCLEDAFYEDCFFTQLSCLYVNRYAIIDKKLYYYFINPNGTTLNVEKMNRLKDEVVVQRAFIDEINARDFDISVFFDELEYIAINKILIEPYTVIRQQTGRMKRQLICFLFDELKQMFPSFENNIYFSEDINQKRYFDAILKVVKAISAVGLADRNSCTGCGACFNICPNGAIKKYYDGEGLLSFEIDENKCTKCGLCTEACPILNPFSNKNRTETDCYAVQCSDNFRGISSSGGVFSAIATSFCQKGGYVCGAIWNDDCLVNHVVSSDMSIISKTFSSKYLQSDTEMVYREIRQLLSEGKEVLFSGCPCQVAGLKAYLGAEYDNLTTIDIVCHGVPSPMIFKSYIDEVLSEHRFANPQISFRDKKLLGWNSGLCITEKNDESVYYVDGNSLYMQGFLSDWYLRQSCYDCQFKNQSLADITLGDFWGIEYFTNDFNDGKGTSLLLINSPKGLDAISKIEGSIQKITKGDISCAIWGNPSVVQSVEKKEKTRNNFFSTYSKLKNAKKAIEKMVYSTHFDIALVLWWSENYGNALTNYALMKIIEKMGKSVCAIDNGVMKPTGYFKKFSEERFTLSSEFIPDRKPEYLANIADTYVIGSDQIWNYQMAKAEGCGLFYYLDFVSDEKRKVAYGASFGGKENLPPKEETHIYANLLRKFDGIGLRESFSSEYWEEYGVETGHVLDPVLMLDAEQYSDIADTSLMPNDFHYIFSYILGPNNDKRNVILKTQEHSGLLPINLISAYSPKTNENFEKLNLDNTLIKVSVPQWIGLIKESDIFITDSFHGACFAMLFHKKVILLANDASERFDMLKKMTNISDCFVNDYSNESLERALSVQVDYDRFTVNLQNERARSMKWLEEKLGNGDK